MHVDPELVRAVQRGAPGSMDALIRASYADVFSLCRRLLGDRDDAADATQEVYVKVVRSVLGFRGEAAFGTWLHRVTVNTCSTMLTKRGDVRARGQSASVEAYDGEALADGATDPADRAVDADLVRRTATALAGLSEQDREVVLLRDVEGLTTKETAGVLGISEGATKVRLHRAHARLRELVSR